MHHNILLRFEFILIALAKIANHNKYITNRNPVKQKKAEDILVLLFNNLVSPIHLIDVVGEYSDLCVNDFGF